MSGTVQVGNVKFTYSIVYYVQVHCINFMHSNTTIVLQLRYVNFILTPTVHTAICCISVNLL